jgi:anti-sigma factor RsiW
VATCQLYEEQLSSYMDGELGAARAARVEAHLRTCPHCREELEALSGIGHHVRSASSDLRVSTDFDRRVLHSFGYWRVTGRPVHHRPLLRPLVAIAMVLLAMLGLIRHYFSEPFRLPRPVAQPSAPLLAPVSPGTIADREDRERPAPRRR